MVRSLKLIQTFEKDIGEGLLMTLKQDFLMPKAILNQDKEKEKEIFICGEMIKKTKRMEL